MKLLGKGSILLFSIVLTGCSSVGSFLDDGKEANNTNVESGIPESGEALGSSSEGLSTDATSGGYSDDRYNQEGEEYNSSSKSTENSEQWVEVPQNKQIFYFAFDSSVVEPADVVEFQKHAEYLMRNPSARVRLEGHADERGSREYNLALGERRARSAADLLTGITPEQVNIVSFGEEQPLSYGQNDASWQQNRRVELIYTAR